MAYFANIKECRSVNCFEKIELRGEGTYGQVFMARDKQTQQIMALKKMKMEKENEGFPVTALRELSILKRMKHPNVVHMVEVVVGSKQESVFLVFEYCEHDLATLLDSSRNPPFSEAEIKRLFMQLLEAVAFMHERWVIHRDIKMSNLLYSKGVLKLCDFGLAREFGTPLRPYTPKVVTLWYRAPELLLGAKTYSSSIDLWSVGAIFGEWIGHAPMVPGQNEHEQISLIFELLGSPNAVIWPGFLALAALSTVSFPEQPYNTITQRLPALSDEGRDLLNGLLTYDPDKRLNARRALKHEYFKQRPVPKPREAMPTFPCPSLANKAAAAAAAAAAARAGGGGAATATGTGTGSLRKRPRDLKDSHQAFGSVF